MSPAKLERYAFLWSEVRLVLAAGALFLGGMPVIYYLMRMLGTWSMSGLVSSLLQIAQLVSGVAAGYLLYRWHIGGHKLFGGTDQKDKIAFLIMGVSGLNLGWYALSSTNIGMDIVRDNAAIFLITGAAYLWAGWHLREQWLKNGEQLFAGSSTAEGASADAAQNDAPETEEQPEAREAEIVNDAEGGGDGD
ncbi:MAG: hypothetical protein LR017_02975 [Candidatus Pacebacteria bacterium]|nr:hypothetical protein [Candidatus Paceibacterota bacterium]